MLNSEISKFFIIAVVKKVRVKVLGGIEKFI